jgi:AAA domain
MNPPSEEQLKVIECLKTNDVKVSSVAGSGKTTCVLHAMTQMKDKKGLLLTYNNKLRRETRERVQRVGITNLDVHTFHSFCVTHYDKTAFVDEPMRRVVDLDVEGTPFRYDVVFVDEAQDLRPCLFFFVKKILRDNKGAGRLCVLGDERQCLYQFQQADARFLSLCPQLFPGSWKETRLTVSYRVPIPVANFVNRCMLHEDKMVGVKPSNVLPSYLIADGMKTRSEIFLAVVQLLELYPPKDIFILSLSIHKNPVANKLENDLKELTSVPIFVPLDDFSEQDEAVTNNKLVFSTFHQSKGRERKAVVVLGFDASHYGSERIDEARRHLCPNTLYVAATRCTERLILVQDASKDALDFLGDIRPFCTVLGEEGKKRGQSEGRRRMKKVTSCLKFLDPVVEAECCALLKVTTLRAATPSIHQKYVVETPQFCEIVADITGTAIPCALEYKIKGDVTIFKELTKEDVDPYKEGWRVEQGELNALRIILQWEGKGGRHKLAKLNCGKVADVLYAATCYYAVRNCFVHRPGQIETYDWFQQRQLNVCLERLQSVMRLVGMTDEPTLQFEAPLFLSCPHCGRDKCDARDPCLFDAGDVDRIKLCGHVDIMDSETVLEVKCVQKLTPTHRLQVALYAFLFERVYGKTPRSYLYNVFTDELEEIASEQFDVIASKILMPTEMARELSDGAFLDLFS